MAKNDLTLLDGILEDYVSKKIPSSKEDEVFEYFATEQILKDYAFSKEKLLSGSVDGRNDGGIDEFFILVNGHIAENLPEDFWPRTNAELEIYIITCKHDSSFKQAPINIMISSLHELFDFSKPSSSLNQSYNELLLKKREVLISTYKRLASALVKFNINIVYACRGDEDIETNILAKAKQAESLCMEYFSECSASFLFFGNSTLLKKFRERSNDTLLLKYDQCINQNGQYVILTSIKDYYSFIVDSNGKLNKCLFDSNVRDYLGLNPVNVDIIKTLSTTNEINFWWLNNGITIIGSSAHIVGNSITIEKVQIVNGLQTSESIYNYFSEHPVDDENRTLLVKILISNDPDTRNSIIYATNNQTNVNVTALRATDKIQHDIEDILKRYEYYYERRTNYYQNLGIPESSIVTPLSLAAGYVCLIYKNPLIATSLKQKFMRDNRKYNQVFSSKTDINVWVPITSLIKKTDIYLSEIKPQNRINTSNFSKNFRQILMFITVSRLLGTFAFGEKQLIDFDLNLYTKEEVQKSLDDLIEIDSDVFSRGKKLKLPFYSKCFNYVSKKYNIDAIQSIEKKNHELWSEKMILTNHDLSQDILDNVLQELPQQPWPVNIHIQISKKLGVNEITVSNAISYLIYSKKVHHQAYGYVFDSENNVVAECEHFGHSEEEARKKVEKQKSLYEKRFSFNF